METKTNIDRGEIIDVILINDIHSTPMTSVTDQMYRIGNGDAFITIQCDRNGKEMSAFCIKHVNKEVKYIKFTKHADAEFISKSCKQRLEAQAREQAKIEKINQRFEINKGFIDGQNQR